MSRFSLFNIFRHRTDTGQEIAAQRLRLVLAHDRANISPGMLAMLKDEIIAVITKHLNIDPTQIQVNLTENQRETRLVADIPLSSPRSKRQ